MANGSTNDDFWATFNFYLFFFINIWEGWFAYIFFIRWKPTNYYSKKRNQKGTICQITFVWLCKVYTLSRKNEESTPLKHAPWLHGSVVGRLIVLPTITFRFQFVSKQTNPRAGCVYWWEIPVPEMLKVLLQSLFLRWRFQKGHHLWYLL